MVEYDVFLWLEVPKRECVEVVLAEGSKEDHERTWGGCPHDAELDGHILKFFLSKKYSIFVDLKDSDVYFDL